MAKSPAGDTDVLERSVDLGAQYAIGVNNAVKGLTDLLGPDNPASKLLQENVDWYRDLLSATALGNEEEVSRILADAENKGVLEQLAAGAKAFGAAPADILAGGLGSLTTFAVGGGTVKAIGLGAKGVAAAQASLGAGMQAGIVKNEIYEGVKAEMLQLGKDAQAAESMARQAQSYSGKNLDQIFMGAGLGAVDGLSGAQRVIGRALLRGGLGGGASKVASVIGNGLAESLAEAAQGAQGKLAANVAPARDGAPIEFSRGVVSSAALEGLAGGVIGTGVASVEPRVAARASRPPTEPSIVPATPAAPATPTTSAASTGSAGTEGLILPLASMGEEGYLPTVEAVSMAKKMISAEGFQAMVAGVMRSPGHQLIFTEGENAELQRSYAVETAARQILEERRLKTGPISRDPRVPSAPAPSASGSVSNTRSEKFASAEVEDARAGETGERTVEDRSSNPPRDNGPAKPAGLSLEKVRVLGVENDAAGRYIASTYPDLTKRVKNPEDFSANVKTWRTKIEQEIEEGKHLNKSIGTGEFLHQYGYEPSAAQYREILDGHRRQQREIQQGWVSYLREGGYSDGVSALILSSITKETAYRSGGEWEFRKLGGSSNRLPLSPDPEVAAQFSLNFNGDRRPSQALAEAHMAVIRRSAENDLEGKKLNLQTGEISWIRIPSKEAEPEKFDANVKRLTDLSRTVEDFGFCKWCTGHGKARDYLEGGDFWVGVDDDGRARLGIRLERGQIQEIRGVLHSQAVEPGLAPQLTKIVSEQSLSGGEHWVNDAEIKGRVAELAKGGTWDDLKRAVGKIDDAEAADFIYSYRGPSGANDFLIGADNNHAQRLAWEKLASRPVSQLNTIARAGSFSQARGWVDGEILDTPRGGEVGGGAAIHGLFADEAGMASRAPNLLKEWGLLTPERQSSVDGDLNNIWHLQAGGRGHSLARAVGGGEKSDLLPFMEWEGVHRPSLFAANGQRLTPIHLCFEKHASPSIGRPRNEGFDPDTERKNVIKAYQRHGDGRELLHDNGGSWKYPIIFSVANGGMLTDAVDAGLVSPADISGARDGDNNTPWHKADLPDIRRMAGKGYMTSSHLGLLGHGGVSVAEAICRRPGGFSFLAESGLINPSNVVDFKGTRPSLAHGAACVGEAEKALESRLFSADELTKPIWGLESNFLHLWGGQGLRTSDPEKLREMVEAVGLKAADFEKVNKDRENAYRFFAEKPGGLKMLAQARLVTTGGIGAVGGLWQDTPLHKLPPHSHETYHLLAEQGVLTRDHMIKENSHGNIPLHQYILDEFNGGGGIDGVKKMAKTIGLRSEDFTARHGERGMDAIEVVRGLYRKMDGEHKDPLLAFSQAGLITQEAIFQQRHGLGEPSGISERTDTQKTLARASWGRSPFEDAVRCGGAPVFAELCQDGVVTAERMSKPHPEDSEWANHTEFVMRTAADDPGWMVAIGSAVEEGVIGKEGLAAEGRVRPGPVFMNFQDFPTPDAMLSALRRGSLSSADLIVEGDGRRGSLLSSACMGTTPSLNKLIDGGHISKGSLSLVSIPYGPDDGNPARYLIEKNPDLFIKAAKHGLFDLKESSFGRDGVNGPLEYSLREGDISPLTKAGLLGQRILDDSPGMRRAWTTACEEGRGLHLSRALVSGGASRDQVRESFLKTEGDGNSALSSLRSRGAADSLSQMAGEDFIRRSDLGEAEGRRLIKGVLGSRPQDFRKLTASGLLAKGDLYSGRFGKEDMVRFAVGFARTGDEEVQIVKGIADAGLLRKEDEARMARDLCQRPAGSAGLRYAIEEGLIGKSGMTARGDDGKSALDILHGRASVTDSRRSDLSFLLERGLVPEEYSGRFKRGAEGKFSSVSDAVDRVTVTLSSLLSFDKKKTVAPLAVGQAPKAEKTAGALVK